MIIPFFPSLLHSINATAFILFIYLFIYCNFPDLCKYILSLLLLLLLLLYIILFSF